MLPARQTMDLVAGMWQLLSRSFTAVSHELWWDNEAGIGRRGRLTDPVTALMGTLDCGWCSSNPMTPSRKEWWSERQPVSGDVVFSWAQLHLTRGLQ
jgi:hypothetical protein